MDRLKVQFGGFSTRLDGFQTQLGDIEAKINRALHAGRPGQREDPQLHPGKPIRRKIQGPRIHRIPVQGTLQATY